VYLYVELWRFRPAWLEMSQGDRKSWMDKLLAGLQQELQSGVEGVGFASNGGDTPHSSGYDFLAVWKMPNKEVARRFEDFVERSGLHEYFEQVNSRGPMMEMEEVVSALLNPQNR
jgi:hypothetical protein